MTNQEKIEAVQRWQNCPLVHPLTCRVNSKHENLVPVEVDNTVVLKCLTCEHVQSHIPECVLTAPNPLPQTVGFADVTDIVYNGGPKEWRKAGLV